MGKDDFTDESSVVVRQPRESKVGGVTPATSGETSG